MISRFRSFLVPGLLVAMAALGAAPGCGGPNDSSGNSNTNWLKPCQADSECGALSCLCGVCTRSCVGASSCDSLSPGAVCAAAACATESVCLSRGSLTEAGVGGGAGSGSSASGGAAGSAGARPASGDASTGGATTGAGGGATSSVFDGTDSTLPPVGAVMIQINAGVGACSAAGAPLTAPPSPAGTTDAVNSALTCDLASPDCDPQGYVLTDGAPETSIACRVSPAAGGFQVSVALISGTRMSFRASGTIQATGGTLQLTETGANTGGLGFSDVACTVDIQPNHGSVRQGAIWAHFDCSHFVDPNAAGQICTATGSFVFSNCDG